MRESTTGPWARVSSESVVSSRVCHGPTAEGRTPRVKPIYCAIADHRCALTVSSRVGIGRGPRIGAGLTTRVVAS